MALTDLPPLILQNFETYEWRHATAILKNDFPNELNDILTVLGGFVLRRSHILTAGGGKSPISAYLDGELTKLGWSEKGFKTQIVVDNITYDTPTHKIDCYKNRIGLDIEWNNKTEFYDRDLNNFRLLHERNAVSVGIIVTRASELQSIFKTLGKHKSYGASTTHMDKLRPRIDGGSGGGCPILIFGIRSSLYDALT
jgi:hypothetical protein